MKFKKTFKNLGRAFFCCFLLSHFSASAQVWHLSPLGSSYKPLASAKYSTKTSNSTWLTNGEVFFTWDADYLVVLEELDGDYKTINTYNSNNERISRLTTLWDSTSQSWQSTNDIISEYNSNSTGLPTRRVTISYNTTNNQWDSTFQTYFIYDNNCRLMEFHSEQYNNNAWKKTEKQTYKYNVNNQLSSFTSYGYNNGAWKVSYLDTIFYNSQNQIENRVTWVNNFNNTKSSANQRQYIYDANGFLIEEYKNRGSLFTQLNQWQPYLKKEMTNNNQGSPIQLEVSNFINNNWVPRQSLTYTYDTENDPVWDTLQSFSNSTSHTTKAEFFYVFPTDIEKTPTPLSTLNCITANPYNGMPIHCTDLDQSKNYQVQLHSITGQLMYSTELNGGERFSIPYHPNISNGVYILSITDGKEERFVKKLIMGW